VCVWVFVLQDINMEYTGTRYPTTLGSGGWPILTGNQGEFVSSQVSNQQGLMANLSNAGALQWATGRTSRHHR
jgi:hypothetical protein